MTGLVGFGRGGPPRRVVAESCSNVAPPGWLLALCRAAPPREIAAYASLISAIWRVATRDASGSSPMRSG